MNAKTGLSLLILIAAMGSVIVYVIGRTSMGDKRSDGHPDQDAGLLPTIDFTILDEARSLDLIDTELEFPDSLKDLEGRRVRLIGFMAPFDNLQDMRRCMIVPSYVGCTFCSPPSFTQVVYVKQGSEDSGDRPYPFIEEPSHVTGTLRLSLPDSEHEGKQQGFIYSMEDATVTPYTGEAPERAPGHGPTSGAPTSHQQGTSLPSLETEELVQQIAEILGREPRHPIEIEAVTIEAFGESVREEVEATFPSARALRTQAFSLLGMLPADADWVGTLAGAALTRRLAAADQRGERILLLGGAPDDHPYVRLELVGEITKAILRQHFAKRREGAGSDQPEGVVDMDDDARRAQEALWLGIQTMVAYRYSRIHGISPAAQPPAGVLPEEDVENLSAIEFDLWQSLPGDVGPFFVDYLVGATGPFSEVDVALDRPPGTTMQLFRPRWYQDPGQWRPDPVPADFADDITDTPPDTTDVLGVGGLVPWLAKWYSVDVAKSLVGSWTGDRWAVWQFPDDSSGLVLEVRLRDEASAIEFRKAIPKEPLQSIYPHQAGSHVVRLARASTAEALARLVPTAQDPP